MIEIPEDAMQAAFAIIDANTDNWSMPVILARAIMAERERCATIAEGMELPFLDRGKQRPYASGFNSAARLIAKDIRALPTEAKRLRRKRALRRPLTPQEPANE